MHDLDVNFGVFSLGDVLQFLSRVKETGVLKITGDVAGEIYLKEGFVVHATDGSEKGLEALFNMTFSANARGSFEVNVRAPEQTISEDMGKLTEDIDQRRIEFESIRSQLPPMETVYAKSTKDLEQSVALRRTDWQLLALIDGKRTLNEVIAQCKIGAYEAAKTIIFLKDKGLLYDPREAERVMSGMLKYLEILFEKFGKGGLDMLRTWSAQSPANKSVCDAILINEENLRVELNGMLTTEQIKDFFKHFDEHLSQQGPAVYGKLLFRKKYEDLQTALKSAGVG